MHGTPGFCHQFHRDEAFLATRENVPTYPGLQGPDRRKDCLIENSLTNYWETDFNHVSRSPSSPALQAFTNATDEGLVEGEGVQLCCASEQRMPERSLVVDRPAVDLEREVVNLPSPRFDSFDRCVLEGLGGSVSGSSYPGGILTAYQCPRTLFALRAFSKNQKKLHIHLRIDNRTAVAYLLKMGGHGLRL